MDFKRQMSAAEKPAFSTLGVMRVKNPKDCGVVELDRRQWVSRLSEKPDNPDDESGHVRNILLEAG